MKILITGVTGCLGGVLFRELSKSGHEVIGLGRWSKPPENLLNYGEYVIGDIRNLTNIPTVDAVVNAAGLSDDNASYSSLYKTNVTGTTNLLRAIKDVPKLIHVSSSSVYNPDSHAILETEAGLPKAENLSHYGRSKYHADQTIISNSKANQTIILRPRALYGVGDGKILPRILKLVNNNTLVMPGKMEIKISATHYMNFVHAVDQALKTEIIGTNIYNIADPKIYSLIEMVRLLTTSIYGKPLPEKVIPISVVKVLSLFRIKGISPLLVRSMTEDMFLDTTKAEIELVYQPKITMPDVTEEIAQWVDSIGGVEVLLSERPDIGWIGKL